MFRRIKKKFIESKTLIRKKLKKYDFLKENIISKTVKIKSKFQENLSILPQYFSHLQNKLDDAVKTDNSIVVLKQSQVWARSITWVLMGGTFFGISWLTFAKTDEVVIARGKLEPKGGVVEVQMPVEGVAREILITEGEKVSKGQTLIQLDTEVTEAQNQSLKESLRINQEILDKLSFLSEQGAVSKLQVLQQKNKLEDIKSRYKSNSVTLKYQQINSPIDGIIFDLQPKGPGYVARTSQPVLKIVPTKNLIAKVEIDSRTIGFVKKGKLAEISIDSFPARNFGVISGKVTRIASDALPPSQGRDYRFLADISLDKQSLKLRNGKELELQAGMSLQANIKLRKVSYLQLLLNQFSDKTDSLKAI